MRKRLSTNSTLDGRIFEGSVRSGSIVGSEAGIGAADVSTQSLFNAQRQADEHNGVSINYDAAGIDASEYAFEILTSQRVTHVSANNYKRKDLLYSDVERVSLDTLSKLLPGEYVYSQDNANAGAERNEWHFVTIAYNPMGNDESKNVFKWRNRARREWTLTFQERHPFLLRADCPDYATFRECYVVMRGGACVRLHGPHGEYYDRVLTREELLRNNASKLAQHDAQHMDSARKLLDEVEGKSTEDALAHLQKEAVPLPASVFACFYGKYALALRLCSANNKLFECLQCINVQKDLRSDLLLEIELDAEPYYAYHYGEVMEFAKKIRSHQLSELKSSSGTSKTIDVVLPAFICVLFARYRDFGGVKALKELVKNIKKRYDDELGQAPVSGALTPKDSIFDQILKSSKEAKIEKKVEDGSAATAAIRKKQSDNLFNHANLVEDLCLHVLRSPEASRMDFENMQMEIQFEQLNASNEPLFLELDVEDDEKIASLKEQRDKETKEARRGVRPTSATTRTKAPEPKVKSAKDDDRKNKKDKAVAKS